MTRNGSEFELIKRLRARLPLAGEGIRLGSGDDAAVVEARRATAISVDSLVEGVHFFRPAFPPEAIGRKALGSALSDLAAVAAEPREAYVCLGLPAAITDEEVLQIADGVAETARRHGVAIAGGDLTRAPVLFVAITVVGEEPAGQRLIGRAGAEPGDLLAITGTLGGAAAALLLLGSVASSGTESAPGDGRLGELEREQILARQLDPEPRLDEGRALAAAGARAMIDVSDGLASDAAQLADASGVGIELELTAAPTQAGVATVCGGGEGALLAVGGGGEDYELLVALRPEQFEPAKAALAALGCDLTLVGKVTAGTGVQLSGLGSIDPASLGFDHRAKRRQAALFESGGLARRDSPLRRSRRD